MFYLESFIEPFGTLWFINLLGVFFVVTKALHRVPVIVIWLLEAAIIETGWMVIDEFASRFVYFYTGYILAPYVFAVEKSFSARGTAVLLGGLGLWAVINGYLVAVGYAILPGISLPLGLVGTAAVTTLSVLFTRASFMDWLRYCGQHSIIIYLSFFVFMAVTRVVLPRLGIFPDAGLVSQTVTFAGVLGPILLFWAVQGTPSKFLFTRPDMLRITGPGRRQPAKVYPAE